jgi:DNA polymerase V
MFALIDCNQFYVSCERIFRPELHNRPVVVLSNNDGCIVTLSPEAQKIGLSRGTPFFKIKKLLYKNNGFACSSNYSLYGDISQRVMNTLTYFSPDVECYSIDEAFLSFPKNRFTTHKNYQHLGNRIQSKLWRDLRMGVGVGIAPTRTLAKLANRIAKRTTGIHVFLDAEEAIPILQKTLLSDVWGIGHRSAQKLPAHTALDFLRLNESIVQSRLGICGLRIHRELHGIPSIGPDLPTSPKSIRHGRSFSTRTSDIHILRGIIARFCAFIGRKLRSKGVFAHTMQLRLIPPRNRNYSSRATTSSFSSTQDTRVLIREANRLLKILHSAKKEWKKAEVLLFDLSNTQQLSLFSPAHNTNIMSILDDLQQQFGTTVIRLAAETDVSPMSSKNRSPRYSTRWSELRTIHI